MQMILVDGVASAEIPADDRGFNYGDGVFRTLAMRRGAAELWPQHRGKLTADCRALALSPPDAAELQRDLQKVAAQMPDCALRITITRGSGERGYAVTPGALTRRVVTASALPNHPVEYGTRGIRARCCTLRLAAQPRLAGIKHLNRLENVLARAEWEDPEIVEGLLFDTDDCVIAGTRSNVFVVEDGALVTPDLSRCGVAGVTRDLVMEAAQRNNIACRVEPVSRSRLKTATEIFLVNSLIGAWPIAMLEQQTWSDFTLTPLVRKWLDALRNPSH